MTSTRERTPTEIERRLIACWEEVFDVSGLDAGADFFELGGDSLAAASIVADLEEVFEDYGATNNAFMALFRWPVLSELAAQLAAARCYDDDRSLT